MNTRPTRPLWKRAGRLAALALVPLVASASVGGEPGAEAPNAPLASVGLSPVESAWLRAHPVLRVAMDPGWPPFSMLLESGGMVGIDPMILNELEGALGVTFETVPLRSWTEIEKALRAREVDFVMGTADLPARRRFALFTEPYLAFPVAVIMRGDSPFFVRMNALDGKSASLPKNYVTTDFIEAMLPGVRVHHTSSPAEALEMVARGESDFTVENLANASYLIRRHGLSNLKIAGLADVKFENRLAVRSDWPELVGILDKALAAIPESRLAAILEEWVPVEVDSAVNWPHILRVAGTVALVGLILLGISIAWNRRIARELALRRRIEAELREKSERLDKLSREKDAFMGMAAHDLNSPLTQIMLASEVLAMRASASDENSVKLIGDIRAGAERMNRLIRNLLSVHVAEAGAARISNAVCHAADVLIEVARRHTPSAAIKTIRIVCEHPPTRLAARISPDVLDQILDNLLGNAIKYSPPGSKVVVRASERDGRIVCEVADEGPGFEREVARSLFTKSVQPGNKPTGGEGSTGLGLAIVRRLCELAQAGVFCESEGPGKGAVFLVVLQPAAAPEKTASGN